ncbi:MAG: B12-binding domain-containing radical SAM protein [Anaerolineae bacterium]|nr:B12-binding domain-containing radical SAM protein [Anaerolineae bacterium]
MKITLIKPNIGQKGHSLYVDEGRMEPLQLGVLAGMTPNDAEVVLYDDRMESIPFDEPTDLVAITIETYTARRAYEISAEYRKRGVPVIMGGMHATLIPDEVIQHTDSLYIGDAEFKWREALEDAEKGELKPIYQSPAGIPQPGIQPRRDIYKGKGYLPISLMQFGRGCNFQCEYCAISVYFDKTHYYRHIDEVLAEIDVQDRKYIFFVDDNIIANVDAAKIFFKELIQMNVRWVSQASINITRDLELMRLMTESGCLGNVIGFESLNQQNLLEMKKTVNIGSDFQDFRPQIEIIKDFGLQTWAAFTLGHDNDTIETIEQTVDFATENKFAFAAYNILMPYPNTPLYRRLEAEGRLLYNGKWWLHPQYQFNHAAFIPSKMSPNELTDATFKARSKFNSIRSIVSRAFDFKANMRSLFRLAVYIAYTPLYRKETFKKQDMSFGYHQPKETA